MAMRIRDEVGELFNDERFASAFAVRGRPGLSPGQLALVTALQFACDLTDRQAGEAVRARIDWKYCLGLELDDPGFDFSVLSQFRARLVEHDLAQVVFDVLLERLVEQGLIKAGGKQRTDSTHVISAVRDLDRIELAGESVRACLEALAVAAPQWLTDAIDVPGWVKRYPVNTVSWRLPSSKAKRAQLAVDYGTDGFALLAAVFDPGSPAWLAALPAVQVLHTVLLQNYVRSTGADGHDEVRHRQADIDGLPPGRIRLTSPYDMDVRWSKKERGAVIWNGYKVHLSETCDDPDGGPNLITNVATTASTVPDQAMTTPIHHALAERGLLPAEHYVDSGYASAALLASSRREFGVTLVTPLMTNNSAQARAGTGYDLTRFTIDFDARQATCPTGQSSVGWYPARNRGAETINVKFDGATCHACPVVQQCSPASTTLGRYGRQLGILPREAYEAQAAARAEQAGEGWQARYARRAGVEGSIHQAVSVTGARHARYRGSAKTRLEHIFAAVAINLIRLDAHWQGRAPDRTRTSQLERLASTLAA
jgi:transposase